MSAVTNDTTDGVLEAIDHKAREVRDLIIEALKGLDEVIALATQQHRDDIVKTATKQRQTATKAAQDFNDEVSGKRAGQLNPEAVNQFSESAKKSERDMRKLYDALKEQVDGHDERLDKIEAVLPKDGEGNLTDVTQFVDGRIKTALDDFRKGARRFVNDVADREVWDERPLRCRNAFLAFVWVAIALFVARWITMGFWAAFGWPLVVVPGVIAIVVLLWDNRSSRSHSTTAPAVREEGH